MKEYNEIPEGLEFRDEYMHRAFELYATAKSKRRRRFILWYSFAAAILLTGLLTLVSQENAAEKIKGAKTVVIPDPENAEGKANLGEVESKLKNAEGCAGMDADSGKETADVIEKVDTRSSEKGENERRLLNSKTHSTSQANAPVERDPKKETSSLEFQKDFVVSNEPQLKKEPEQRESTPVVLFDPITIPERYNVQYIQALPAFGVEYKSPGLKLNNYLYFDSRISVRPWSLYVSAGLVPFKNYASGKYRVNPDPEFRLGLNRNFSSSTTLSLGLGYYSISGIESPYTASQTYYNQGFQTTEIVIETSKLHYAEISPEFRYSINKKHQLALGYALSYLINGENKIHTSVYSDLGSGESASTNTKGYVEGFRTFNHGMALSYDYLINPRWAIGARAHVGLTDITRAEFFALSGNDRNSRLTLHLKYIIR